MEASIPQCKLEKRMTLDVPEKNMQTLLILEVNLNLEVNHRKAYKIWILSQYSQFSAAQTQTPNLRLKMYHSLLSMQLDSCMLAHSGMLATTRAILLGIALTRHYECLVHDCNLQSNLWVPKSKSYQESGEKKTWILWITVILDSPGDRWFRPSQCK